MRLLHLLLLPCFLACLPAEGQKPSGAKPSSPGKLAVALATLEAERYEISIDPTTLPTGTRNQEALPAKLRREPVLVWSNPLDSVHGAVFCWLCQGRPAVIASIYKNFSDQPKFSAEFQSLHDGAVTARRDGKVVWNPKLAGVNYRTLAGVSAVTTKTLRNIQMRQVARRFSVTVRMWDDKQERKLRLLPQPLMSFESKDRGTMGGVFAFVVATDPDLLLILETSTEADQPGWRYALARLSINETTVRLDDQPVWNRDEHVQPFERPGEPYTILDALDEPVLPEAASP